MTRWIERVSQQPQARPSHELPVNRRTVHAVNPKRTLQVPVPEKTEPLIIELPVVQPPDETPPDKSNQVVPPPPTESSSVPAAEQVQEQYRPMQAKSRARFRLPKLRNKPNLKWAIPAAMLILVSIGVYTVVNWSREPVKSNVLSAQTVEEVAAINTDEEPVVLYVTDKTKVAQPFLDKAENGDEVRLYYQARKAVLYRPSTYSVISVGEFVPPPAKIFIRNGTNGTVQLARVEAKLRTLTQFNIASKDRSSSSSYEGTIVVDINGRYPADTEKLAAELGATVGSLPKSEIAPEADILIIVGAQ